MEKTFWENKRVLVTGHTGFKGGWLSLWLQSMGAKVCGIALSPPTNPALFNVARVSDGMDNYIADIRDFNLINFLVGSFKPEIIFHLAAQPLVRLSYKTPLETYSTNVIGTVNLLEASRHVGSVRSIVVITTDKCYDNREWLWGYRENEPLGGLDPYSSSKACAELVVAAYRSSFLKHENIAVATGRAGNVIGGGDWALDRLVPDILRALEKNENVHIRNPNAIRPWQHVLEPLSGYLTLAEQLFKNGQTDAESWNFGPWDEDAKSVEWIVKRFCELWGNKNSWIMQSGIHPHEATFLKLDISKARQRLNWSPRLSLENAIVFINEWHKAWLSDRNMRDVCFNQISRYESFS